MSRTRRVRRRVGILSTWLLGVVAFLMALTVVLFYTLSNVPRPEDLPLPQVATITYADGSTLTQVGTDRKPVPLARIPDAVRWAVIATEDRGFYSEPGFSIRGTLRAAVHDVTGGDAQGGSGLTQQYVKNAYLSSDRTLYRKLKELAIAVKLARNYSKDEILERYLNTVYFGRGAYGVETASELYFGTSVDRLGPAQGALLAALLRSPSYFDPAVNPQAAKDRWHYVVDSMVATGHLDKAQAAALTFPTTVPDRSNRDATGPSGILAHAVRNELVADGIDESIINTRGLRVQTTVDKSAQAAAVAAIQQAYRNPSTKQKNLRQAMVAVNPATGAILAYYGGSDAAGFDYARAWRQPGSTFKPFTLATALAQNLAGAQPSYTLDSMLPGASPQTIDGQVVQNDPSENAQGSYTLTQAMTISLNTVFYRLAALVKPANVAALAHAAGISPTWNGKPSLETKGTTTPFIGIGAFETTPVDMADAYATFADGGTARSAYLVQKVTDDRGNLLFQHKDSGKRVMDPKVANDTTLSMEQVASSSGISPADGRPVAAKTGTVGIQGTRNASDAWTVGFTPQVSVASWAGADNGSDPIYDDRGLPMYGRENPGQAWKLFMDAFLARTPVTPLPTTAEVGVAVAPTTAAPPTTTPASPPSSATTSAPPPTTSAPPTTNVPPPTTTAPPTTTVPSATRSPAPPASSPPPATSAPPSVALGSLAPSPAAR
jgi:membrane peptidoglycan carboxypeptidase